MPITHVIFLALGMLLILMGLLWMIANIFHRRELKKGHSASAEAELEQNTTNWGTAIGIMLIGSTIVILTLI